MKSSNSFRYKFTAIIWILLALVLIISLGGMGFNIYNIVLQAQADSPKLIVTVVILVVNLLLTIFTLSVMIASKYVVKNACVYSYFGFLRSKIKVQDVTQFTHFKVSDTLVEYLKDDKYLVVVISPSKYDDFVKAVRELNSQIVYDLQEQEN